MRTLDAESLSPEELELLKGDFDRLNVVRAIGPKVGRMKLRLVAGEHRYAIAERDGANLWLALWVRRSRKGEYFTLVPSTDPIWDVHTSYHLDGQFHLKSDGRKGIISRQLQPLSSAFRGTEHMGIDNLQSPASMGAICDPGSFSGVIELPRGLLKPRGTAAAVDLVEPGHSPMVQDWKEIYQQQVFRDVVPWVVITVGSLDFTTT